MSLTFETLRSYNLNAQGVDYEVHMDLLSAWKVRDKDDLIKWRRDIGKSHL